MKKLSALFLALCMVLAVFTLTACGGGEKGGSNGGGGGKANGGDAYDIVSAAITKTLAAKSYEAKLSNLLKTNLMGRLSEDGLDVTIQASALDSAKPVIRVKGDATMQGQSMPHDYYYDGEWQYYSMGTEGYKFQTTLEEFSKQAGGAQDVVAVIPKEVFGKTAGTKNADGSLTVTLNPDEAAMETLFKETITGIVYDVVGEDLNQAVTKDGVITITVKDGYVTEYKVSFVCEITAGSDKVTYDSTQTITFVSCDKEVTVVAPENIGNFYEMSWG